MNKEFEFPRRQSENKTGCWSEEKVMEGNPQSIAKWDFGVKKPQEMSKPFAVGYACVCVRMCAHTINTTSILPRASQSTVSRLYPACRSMRGSFIHCMTLDLDCHQAKQEAVLIGTEVMP